MTRMLTGMALATAAFLAAPSWAADPSFNDLAAAVDQQQAPKHSPVERAAPVPRSAAPTRPLLHSYGSQPRVSVRASVPIGRYAQIHYSPAFGYRKRDHLGFRNHYRGSRDCPPRFRGRYGGW